LITDIIELVRSRYEPYEQPAIILFCTTLMAVMAEDFFEQRGDPPEGGDAGPGNSARPQPSTH